MLDIFSGRAIISGRYEKSFIFTNTLMRRVLRQSHSERGAKGVSILWEGRQENQLGVVLNRIR